MFSLISEQQHHVARFYTCSFDFKTNERATEVSWPYPGEGICSSFVAELLDPSAKSLELSESLLSPLGWAGCACSLDELWLLVRFAMSSRICIMSARSWGTIKYSMSMCRWMRLRRSLTDCIFGNHWHFTFLRLPLQKCLLTFPSGTEYFETGFAPIFCLFCQHLSSEQTPGGALDYIMKRNAYCIFTTVLRTPSTRTVV